MKGKVSGLLQFVLVLLVIGGAMATSFWLATLRQEAQPTVKAKERTLVVTAQTVDPILYRVNFNATGTVQVRSSVSLVPQVSGKIVSISEDFFAGGVFSKNEPLFKIEPDDFKHEVQRLKAELARAETALELEQAEVEAAKKEWIALNQDTDIPPLVARRPQLKEAQANLESARAQLATARLNLKRTEFTLPFKGRITAANAELGQFITAGQSLGEAYSLEAVEIEMPLEDREYGWILESASPDITVTTSYLGEKRSMKAKVKRLGAEFDPLTRLTRVILKPEEMPDKANIPLLPGVFVDIEVIGPTRRNTWLLPIEALQEDNTIWEILPDDTLKLHKPEIINITRDYVAAKSNGKAIRVVTTPLPEATQGTKARLKTTQGGNGK